MTKTKAKQKELRWHFIAAIIFGFSTYCFGDSLNKCAQSLLTLKSIKPDEVGSLLLILAILAIFGLWFFVMTLNSAVHFAMIVDNLKESYNTK